MFQPPRPSSARSSGPEMGSYEDSEATLYEYDEDSAEEGSQPHSDNNNNNDLSFDDPHTSSIMGKRDEKRLAGFRNFFQHLSTIFPQNFKAKSSVVPYYEARHRGSGDIPSDLPLLIIKPELSGSWLDPPTKAVPEDTVKIWDDRTVFPRKGHVNPTGFPLAAKNACPYISFEDSALDSFLKGPSFKKAELDPAAFDRSSIDLSGTSSAKVDALLRPALRDSFVMDELLKMLLELANSLTPRMEDDDSSLRLELILSSLEMTAECNQRSGQAMLASLVASKLALRDNILRRFVVPKYSRSVLRGSDFKSDKVFGPLPESFKASLLQPNAKEFRCTTKPRISGSSKFKNPSYGTYTSKPSKFSTKRRSSFGFPPAKKSKGEDTKFFRGKGRKRK